MSENQENQKVNIKERLFQNKNVVIIAVVVFVFLLAFVPIMITVISDKDGGDAIDNPDTGIVLSGTYSENVGVGSSKYTFNENNVTNVYVVNGEEKTIDYTYVIAIEDGVKVIKLTTVGEDGIEETTTHEFEQGKFGDTPIILINNVMYYLSEN